MSIYILYHSDNSTLYSTCLLLQELQEAIRREPIVYGDVKLSVTMTFGLTEGNGEKIEHIVRDADAKMYEGKNSGRDKVVV